MLTPILDLDLLRDHDMIALPETPAVCSRCGRTGHLLARICNACRDFIEEEE